MHLRATWQSVCILILCTILITACGTPTIPVTQISDPDKTKSSDPMQVTEGTADFEGVSFRYDANTFGDLKSEIVPAVPLGAPDEKPDYVAPEHVLFTFALGREEYTKAHIGVYPLNGFPAAYSISPSMEKSMNEEIAGLRKVLQDSSFRLDGEIPHLPYGDSSDNFYVKVRHFDFENGNGIIFVTHWMHGPDLVSNRNLIYRFEGITRDGKFYVTAEMPVSVDFLPDDSPREFEGYTYENLYDFSDYKTFNERNPTKRFETYIESIASRLENLKPRDYSPNLEKFEAVISSLQVSDKK